jgi:hypothetical protein
MFSQYPAPAISTSNERCGFRLVRCRKFVCDGLDISHVCFGCGNYTFSDDFLARWDIRNLNRLGLADIVFPIASGNAVVLAE